MSREDHDRARRHDLDVICGRRAPARGTDALLLAADALNRLGICTPSWFDDDADTLFGDALVTALAAGPLPAPWIVGARQCVTSHPGSVAREPALVALWDEGPECPIVAHHSGDGDYKVIGHVPWAGLGVHVDRNGEVGMLDEHTAVGRAQRRYHREWMEGGPGARGTPRFAADLDSESWNNRVHPRWLR